MLLMLFKHIIETANNESVTVRLLKILIETLNMLVINGPFFNWLPVNIDGVFVLYFWWGYVQNEDPGQIRW